MEVPRYWRLQKQRYRLLGEECPHCSEKIFPPRDLCPRCNSQTKKAYQFSGKGEIYSETTSNQVPAEFKDQAPLRLALITLEEGPMVLAQLTDVGNEQIEIGTQVEMVTRKLKDDGGDRGIIVYGYKFRPLIKRVPGKLESRVGVEPA